MSILETERLMLRPFCEEDLDAYAELCSDEDVMRYLGDGRPFSYEESQQQIFKMLNHWSQKGFGMWALQDKEYGDLLGRVGFYYPQGWPGFEIGWLLGKPYWGKGFATEAALIALDWAFSHTQYGHIISIIQPQNHASIRVAERIGEQYEQTMEISGKLVFIYGLYRESM